MFGLFKRKSKKKKEKGIDESEKREEIKETLVDQENTCETKNVETVKSNERNEGSLEPNEEDVNRVEFKESGTGQEFAEESFDVNVTSMVDTLPEPTLSENFETIMKGKDSLSSTPKVKKRKKSRTWKSTPNRRSPNIYSTPVNRSSRKRSPNKKVLDKLYSDHKRNIQKINQLAKQKLELEIKEFNDSLLNTSRITPKKAKETAQRLFADAKIKEEKLKEMRKEKRTKEKQLQKSIVKMTPDRIEEFLEKLNKRAERGKVMSSPVTPSKKLPEEQIFYRSQLLYDDAERKAQHLAILREEKVQKLKNEMIPHPKLSNEEIQLLIEERFEWERAKHYKLKQKRMEKEEKFRESQLASPKWSQDEINGFINERIEWNKKKMEKREKQKEEKEEEEKKKELLDSETGQEFCFQPKVRKAPENMMRIAKLRQKMRKASSPPKKPMFKFA